MNALRFALRNLWRDLKSGELAVLLLALSVATASQTAVGFFTGRITAAVRAQAGEVLAADLRLEGSRQPAPALAAAARERGLAYAETWSFPTAIFRGEQSQLASIQAAGPGYPLRGRLRTAQVPFGPSHDAAGLPGRGEAWVDARLIAQLGLAVGEDIRVGEASLRIGAVLDYRPDQGTGFVSLAPAVLMNIADVPATGLIQPGSRVTYAALFAGAPAEVAALRAWLVANKGAGERLRDVADSSRQLNAAIDRATRFLSLSGLAAVLLSAVAVAMGARRYVERHLDAVALMKCMGATQRFVLAASVLELLVLALAAVAAGSLAGFVAQQGIAWLLRGLVNAALPPASFLPVLAALATVVAMLVGFALPPLLQLRRTPPLRVLRRDLGVPPLRFGIAYLLAAAALAAILWTLVQDDELVLIVLASITVAAAVLALAGYLLVRLTGRLRGGVGVAWRYGLANVARRGASSVVQVVAFGLGLMVLLVLAFVRGDLVADWRRSLARDTPNEFLINIRADERAPLQAFLAAHALGQPAMFPMVRARLTAINGTPAAQVRVDEDRGRAFIEREHNLTWSADLMPDNEIIAGRWWGAGDARRPLVSVSTELQEALHLRLGDQLQFDVAGETLGVRIASFRKVRWDSFRPNFFLVFPPGLLEGAAGTWMTSFYLAPEARPVLVELVRRFPSLTVFDVDAILKQVRDIIDRATLAVQCVFLFTLVAGIVVLLAAVQATRDERRYESAMLRTLGASRRTVLQGVAAEFGALGLLSGVLAATGASLAGAVLARRLFSLHYGFDPWIWAAGLACGTLLVGISGTLATRRVVSTPPVVSLRET